jgi:hypothetical protein
MDEGTSTGDTGSDSGATSSDSSAATTTEPSTTTSATTTSTTTDATVTTGAEEGWIEIGWGLDVFTPFEEGGPFPIYRGTQGLYMFTMPIRGGGFPLPPDPSDFTHPDIPMLDVWLDIEGYEVTPDGHFIEYTDYPVPFDIDLSAGGTYEYVSVWMVISETTDPAALEGLPAQLHAELSCADGQVLIANQALVVGSVIETQ